ncbi:hypothetical protein ACIBQ5_30915 [Streptomyces massasporeus]
MTEDILAVDPMLTEAERRQASSWRPMAGRFEIAADDRVVAVKTPTLRS